MTDENNEQKLKSDWWRFWYGIFQIGMCCAGIWRGVIKDRPISVTCFAILLPLFILQMILSCNSLRAWLGLFIRSLMGRV